MKKKKIEYKNVFEQKNFDGKKFVMTKKLWWKERHLMWRKVGNEEKNGKRKKHHITIKLKPKLWKTQNLKLQQNFFF